MDPALLLAAGIVVVAMGVAWQVPSQAHWALLVVGFSMDPIRKVVPGQPVWLTAIVAGILFLIFIRQQQPDAKISRPLLLMHVPRLALPIRLAGLLVGIQALRGYGATDSLTVTSIGALSYIAPVVAVSVGWSLAFSIANARRVLTSYIICVAIMAVSILMAFLGVKWQAFEQVGTGLVVYDMNIGVIQLHSGFIRGPEMAGWHCGTAVCLLTILVATSHSKRWVVLAIPATALLGLAMFVTGRRKYLMATLAFALLWGAISGLHQRRHVLAVLAWLGVGLAALAMLSFDAAVGQSGSELLTSHAQRVGLGSEQAQGRFFGMTLDAIPAAIEHTGFLGAGAGVGSQGAQHFKSNALDAGWAAEGGFGKIVVELGVPGLALIVWVMLATGTHALLAVERRAHQGVPGTDEACGLLCVLATCAMTFSLGHQVYGDPFVVSVLGLLIGMMLRLLSLVATKGVVSHQDGAPRCVTRLQDP